MQTKTSTAYPPLHTSHYLPHIRQLTNTRHSSQNGTRCRDGVKVLWCRSYLIWLVFKGSIPTCACFHLENIFGAFYLWGIAVLQVSSGEAERSLSCTHMVSYHHDWRETWHFMALTIQWTLVALMKFLKVKKNQGDRMCSLSVRYCWWDIFTSSFASLYL